jgi:glutathione S-transferase
MIQLHYYPGNASLIPHLLLEELGLPFELQYVDRAQSAQKSPAYLKLNPNGLIPVLVDGPLVLYETAAICLHLADANPKAGMMPPLGTPERAHAYKWLAWLTNTLQAALIIYFYPERWMNAGNAAGAAELKGHAEAKIGAMLEQLDAQFAARAGKRSADWLLGARYSVLDPYAFVLCRWTRGFARPARSLPHLKPFLERMLARPAVQRAFATEKIAAPYV